MQNENSRRIHTIIHAPQKESLQIFEAHEKHEPDPVVPTALCLMDIAFKKQSAVHTSRRPSTRISKQR